MTFLYLSLRMQTLTLSPPNVRISNSNSLWIFKYYFMYYSIVLCAFVSLIVIFTAFIVIDSLYFVHFLFCLSFLCGIAFMFNFLYPYYLLCSYSIVQYYCMLMPSGSCIFLTLLVISVCLSVCYYSIIDIARFYSLTKVSTALF